MTDTLILSTLNSDGSADFTIAIGDDRHKFSASSDDGTATLVYEESMLHRGQVRVSEPSERIFKRLMQSDEVTEYLEKNGIGKITRRKRESNHRR